MSVSLELPLNDKSNSISSIRENIESVLSFLPVRVGINLAKWTFFPFYFGVALIANGARDEIEAPPSVVQRVAEIGAGIGVLAMDAGLFYSFMRTSYFI